MSHEPRLRFLKPEMCLSESEVELERLKNEKMRSVIKKGVGNHFEAHTRETKMVTCIKPEAIRRLTSEIGTRRRVDGFERKISSNEKSNLKLTTHNKNLFLETELTKTDSKETRSPQKSAPKNTIEKPKVIGIKEMHSREETSQSELNEISGPRTKKAQVDQLRHPMLSVTPRLAQKELRPPFNKNNHVKPQEDFRCEPQKNVPFSNILEQTRLQEDLQRELYMCVSPRSKLMNETKLQEDSRSQTPKKVCPNSPKKDQRKFQEDLRSELKISASSRSNKMDPAKTQDDVQSQSPMNLTPRSAKQEQQNSQEDIRRQSPKKRSPRTYNQDTARLPESPTTTPSKQNEVLRPWYERLPLPDIESFLDDESQESGNNVEISSTDSDLDEKIPIKVPSPRRFNAYEGGMGREGAVALRPRPVIRKSCQLYADSLSTFGDGDTVLGVDNEAFAARSGGFAPLVLLPSLNFDDPCL